MATPPWKVAVALLGLFVVAMAAGCGGGGGGDGSTTTTIRGNVADQTAFLSPAAPSSRSLVRVVWVDLLSPIGVAQAQLAGVEVCVEGTGICTTTDADGSFVLPADVSGTVTLTFSSPSFTATLTLADVVAGSTITLNEIRCSLSSGRCNADRIDIDEPSASDPSEPSEPSDASLPSDPSDPSEPSLPSEPSEPSTPSDPSDVSDVSDVSPLA